MTKKLFMREKYEKLGQHLKRRSLKNGDIGFCACVHSTSVVCGDGLTESLVTNSILFC